MKKEILEREAATDGLAAAPADGETDGVASYSPPSSNRGGTEIEDATAFQESFECYETYIMDSKGNILGVPLRRGVSDSSFIDQISFSFHERTFFDKYGTRISLLEDEDFVKAASMLMYEIMGFGIYKESKGSGGRFYERCWLMGDEDVLYGRVHFGGQNQTMLVELTATGCTAAKNGWESRLYEFLTQAVRPKITRVDIAKDFFNGEYSPNQAREDRNKGLFTCHHVKPKGECIGSDWEEEDEEKMTKGKTYGIGSRESSKYVRVYEKGKQLGDKSSVWTRFEIEFKSKDIVIPFEVLQNPGLYFGGAYPICEKFANHASRIQAVEKNKVISADRYVEWVKKQFGRAANGLKAIFPDLKKDELFELIEPDHQKLPKSLSLNNFDCKLSEMLFIHSEKLQKNKEKADPYFMYEYYQNMEKQLEKQKHEINEESCLNYMYSKYSKLPMSWAY